MVSRNADGGLAVDRRPSDVNVWRAAQEIIRLFPQNPQIAACQHADAAWEEGDVQNFRYWMRVAVAVRDLIRTRPHVRKAIN